MQKRGEKKDCRKNNWKLSHIETIKQKEIVNEMNFFHTQSKQARKKMKKTKNGKKAYEIN